MTSFDELPTTTVAVTVNGVLRTAPCPDRTLLVEFLRDDLGLKGTHAGCLNGDCGSCTVLVDGRITKSCLLLAPAADGSEITTIEGLGAPGALSPLQEAFWDNDGLQCGFCLPGHLFAARELLATDPDPDDDAVRAALAGNLCRCTGYQKIVDSVQAAARAARTPRAQDDDRHTEELS